MKQNQEIDFLIMILKKNGIIKNSIGELRLREVLSKISLEKIMEIYKANLL